MVLKIPIDGDKPWECGAYLLTILTCVKSSDSAGTASIFESLCAKAMRLEFEAAPDDPAEITGQRRILFRDQKVVEKDFSDVQKRFAERRIAGHLAIPFLQRAAGVPIKLPAAMKELSLNKALEYMQGKTGYSGASNIATRIWRPSGSVVHLCAAVLIKGIILGELNRRQYMIRFLRDAELTRSVIELSETFARFILEDKEFPINFRDLIVLQVR